jgi:hypothetical protein
MIVASISSSLAFLPSRSFGGAALLAPATRGRVTTSLSVLGEDADSTSKLKAAVKQFAAGTLSKEDFEKLVRAEEAKAKVKADAVTLSRAMISILFDPLNVCLVYYLRGG